jgi:catechol 2,3-dioxygenase-like lactoylglutathione lyase family enzyme
VRVSLDHAHIFASEPAATVDFFKTMFGAAVVWDEVVAGARVIRLQIGRSFIEVYDQAPKAGPDDPLIELFECHEPGRWRIRSDD